MKLRNKLILSCAALAAVATTAVSTTYAWYTANREVTASGLTAKTESNGDDLLLISRTGLANSWSSSVDLSDIDVTFTPVYKDASGAFKLMTADATTGKEVLTTAAAAGSYITFDLYFKSGNNSDLSVKFKSFQLTAENLDGYLAKSTLTSTGIGNVGSTYSVNILRALTMEMVESKALEGTGTATAAIAAADPNAEATAYQFNGKASDDSFAGSYSGTYNAHEYYNAVLGTHIEESADGSIAYRTGSTSADTFTPGSDTRRDVYTATTSGSDTVPALVNTSTGVCTGWSFTNKTGSGTADEDLASETNTGISVLKVHFDIYLDGWDLACFDACQGQRISLAMTFETLD